MNSIDTDAGLTTVKNGDVWSNLDVLLGYNDSKIWILNKNNSWCFFLFCACVLESSRILECFYEILRFWEFSYPDSKNPYALPIGGILSSCFTYRCSLCSHRSKGMDLFTAPRSRSCSCNSFHPHAKYYS